MTSAGLSETTLHSIMFLLILTSALSGILARIFTFHNVSINTGQTFGAGPDRKPLHSIMFLLIQE